MEGIAARAGVGKTTIYRRYASKEEVVIAAITSVHAPVDIPDSGDSRQDMIELANSFRDQTITSVAFPVVRHLFGLAATHPEIMETIRNKVARPRQAAMREIIQRGIERGEIRDDIDPDIAVDMLPGVMVFRFLFNKSHEEAPSREFIVRLVDMIWNGMVERDSDRSDED